MAITPDLDPIMGPVPDDVTHAITKITRKVPLAAWTRIEFTSSPYHCTRRMRMVGWR